MHSCTLTQKCFHPPPSPPHCHPTSGHHLSCTLVAMAMWFALLAARQRAWWETETEYEQKLRVTDVIRDELCECCWTSCHDSSSLCDVLLSEISLHFVTIRNKRQKMINDQHGTLLSSHFLPDTTGKQQNKHIICMHNPIPQHEQLLSYTLKDNLSYYHSHKILKSYLRSQQQNQSCPTERETWTVPWADD